MNRFEDCTKRDAQSATKLYNQESVHGTRGAECFAVFNYLSYKLPIKQIHYYT